MSNGLDPDQDKGSVGPDLGPNCLQWLSADNIFFYKNKSRGAYSDEYHIIIFLKKVKKIWVDISYESSTSRPFT